MTAHYPNFDDATSGWSGSGATAPIAAVNFLFEVACDESAPTLSVSVSPNALWPPNHKYVTVNERAG